MILYPEIKVKRQLPQNLRPEDLIIYEPSLEGLCLASELKVFKNVRFNRELFIFKGLSIFEDSFAWPSQAEKYKTLIEKAKFVIKNHLLRKQKTEELVLWCLNNYSTGGYFHWLTEVLPRLWLIREHIQVSKLAIPDYFLARWDFIKETLPAFGQVDILSIENSKVYFTEKLILPTPTGGPVNYQREPVNQVSSHLKNFFFDPDFISPGERIYISRSKAKHRKVINEDSLLPILDKYGFIFLNFENLDFKTQLNIMCRTKYLIGIHGAGLTNIMFMEQGSKLLELRTPEPLNWLNCFFTLANTFSIDYYYLKGTPLNNPSIRKDDESLYIDATEFENAVREML